MTIDFHAHPVPDAFRKWLPMLGIAQTHRYEKNATPSTDLLT
jgi:hypothetical protein